MFDRLHSAEDFTSKSPGEGMFPHRCTHACIYIYIMYIYIYYVYIYIMYIYIYIMYIYIYYVYIYIIDYCVYIDR